MSKLPKGRSKDKSDFLTTASVGGGYSALTGGFAGFHGSAKEDMFCLKRLLKKDSTTKLKALQELEELFTTTLSNEQLEPLAAALVHTFNRLALDNDKRIREHLHTVLDLYLKALVLDRQKHEYFVKNHVKRIITFWWFHKFDPVPEVSAVAHQSFQTL
ncbi:hypothetical protein RFI_19203, partial [Reticulomyxa filosa]